jgi:uncharacterized protein YjbJ (UPF0337 family)
MSDDEREAKKDEAKGRVEEAAGDLTGRDDLREEGQVDEDTGEAHHKMDQAEGAIGGAVDSVADKVKGAVPDDEDSADDN